MKTNLSILLILIFTSCENALVNEELPTDQNSIFNLLWEDFDTNYAGFTVREINWDSIRTSALSKIDAGISEQAYFDLLGEILISFEDIHTELSDDRGQRFRYNPQNPNSLSHIGPLNTYIISVQEIDNIFTYGKIRNEDIGYIQIPSFSSDFTVDQFAQIDKIIQNLGELKGLIIDVRNNGGGEAANQKIVARRFINNTFTYNQIQFRNGPNHTDFDTPITDDISPNENENYTKPIVILTNRSTGSSAETFVMTLKTQDHIQIVGDTTAGGLGLNAWRTLPNGWSYRMTLTLNSNKDGISFEGHGIPPDEVVFISEQEVIEGVDLQLERAIEILR